MRVEHIGNATLYLADCMDIMRDMPDKAFDLAIVDPPYGIDIANMNMGAGKGKKCSKIQNRKWEPIDVVEDSMSGVSEPQDFLDELGEI